MAATWVRDIWHDKWISFAPKGSILCLSELAFSCKQKIHAKAIFKLKSIHFVADTLWWNYSKNKLHVLQILLLVYWLITVALNYYQDGRPRDQYSFVYGLVGVGTVQPLSVSVKGDTPNNCFNDAKCDRRGRLWCGTADGGSATVPGFPSA